DLLTDSEISRCLQLNVPLGMNFGGEVFVSQLCGMRHCWAEVKRVASPGPGAPDLNSSVPRSSGHADAFLNVVHALRVFKSGQVSSPAIVRFSEDWPVNGGTNASYFESGTTSGGNYSLSAEEAKDLPRFWAAFWKARSIPFVDMAIRRFGYAG